ncbi:hypothetical protein CK203_046829 [Vitis vinifera]|uniref:Uncharacterized protein n=1 Tax=Vitis vinifera TaxID=29760 RepID=A0A438HY99_VITVI|nr:hypothetical protein CK203_046829 [Vitis vinifera]
MAKTRGGLSASPSSPMPRPTQFTIRDATSLVAQDSTVPPSEGGTPSQRRYPTRRPPTDPVPPTTKAKRLVSHPRRGPSSRVLESHPSHLKQLPTKDSQILVEIPLETIIMRPIEGNLDCRDRSFHLETWFDIDSLRQ